MAVPTISAMRWVGRKRPGRGEALRGRVSRECSRCSQPLSVLRLGHEDSRSRVASWGESRNLESDVGSWCWSRETGTRRMRRRDGGERGERAKREKKRDGPIKSIELNPSQAKPGRLKE